MGLRCLLGHDFDEPELQREREEDGNEVVTTVTEVKTCARCGETQIVSENTEVTTMEQLADEATAAGSAGAPLGSERNDGIGDADGHVADAGEIDQGTADHEAVGTPGAHDTTGANGVGDTAGDDAVILDDGPEDPSDDEGRTAEAAGDDGDQFDDAGRDTDDGAIDGDEGAELLDQGGSGEEDDSGLGGDYEEYPDVENGETRADTEERAETDDGVILDETESAGDDRKRGAWPEMDEEESAGAEPTPWPEQAGEDEGYSAEIGDEDGDSGVEFGGGLTPETAGTADDEDVEFVETPEQSGSADAEPAESVTDGTGGEDGAVVDEGVEITRGGSPDTGPSSSDVTTEYYCPECEMTRSTTDNSMRAGDICPECKRGYVTERPL